MHRNLGLVWRMLCPPIAASQVSFPDGPESQDATSSPMRTRTALLLCVVGVSLPFLMAPFPPSTDLAQHMAQVRLAGDVLAGRAPELAIAWLAPNNLVYAILAALSAVMAPTTAARVGLWLVMLCWTLATLALAVRRGRDPLLGVVASVLAFQSALYWGFLNFLVGWPVFVVWLQLTSAPVRTHQRWRHGLALIATGLLLYSAHILWFALGGVWLLLAGILTRPPVFIWLLRLGSMVPGAWLAAVWYPQLTQHRARFETGAMWRPDWWQRLHPLELLKTIMGGPAGPGPAAIGGALVFWVLVVLVTRWGEVRRHSDRMLLSAAAMMGLLALVGPDKYMNTIHFGQRWAPCAAALLLVGLPAPRLRLRVAFSVGLLGAACTATCLAWLSFATMEMSGFRAALDASPPNARVLGLDMVGESEFVGGRPFMQMMAYVQAEKGGSLHFSFAEHGSSLVSYRSPREFSWNPALAWHPERVRTEDVLAFDIVLMNAVPRDHETFRQHAPVVPITETGRWRLYAVGRPMLERKEGSGSRE
jgi:hypothetical protein